MTGLDLLIWLAFAAAQLADIWTTNKALRTPCLREGYPLWRRVQARAWAFGGRWTRSLPLPSSRSPSRRWRRITGG